MSRILTFIVASLAIYSSILIGVELSTSQDFVRHYFTDIQGPVPFYAINTSLSVFFLWATALLFAIAAIVSRWCENPPHTYWFCLSQVAIFGFLGCDDRFKFHEKMAEILGIGDHYILLATGTAEGLFLVWLGRTALQDRRARNILGLAVSLFAVMLFFDACVPHDMVLRLSLEDLAKTWATFCFWMFGWSILFDQLHQLRSRPLPMVAA